MDLQAYFDRGMRCAAQGQYPEAARAYEAFIEEVQDVRSGISPSQRPSLIRSAAFNLAQVLNKQGEYARALTYVDMGLACGPTPFGRAIAMAAKGEALCGLKRVPEGQAAFQQAVEAHPVVGRLNSAESMARLGTPSFLDMAEDWVKTVETNFGRMLDENLRAEADSIRREVAAKRKSTPR